jgi:hypothetical protein
MKPVMAAMTLKGAAMSRSLTIAFALFLTLMGAQSAQSQERNESVRVATYNAFLLSPFFKCFNPNFADCLVQINGETEKWANHLADQILADTGRFDIIVINEAWDEDAKSILVRRLRNQYPNFVRKLDADLIQFRGQSLKDILLGQPQAVVDAIFGGAPVGKINGEDSGLMLFANRRFEFMPFPNNSFKWGSGSGQTLEASTKNVAFSLFESCASADCFSAKGAGLVRLRQIDTRRIYNIVFTHLQADYPEDNDFNEAERTSQLEQIQKLIETTLDPLGQREQSLERLIMLGDLNIAPLTTGLAEWKKRFDTSGSFYTKPIYDAWSRTTSPQDKGITNDNDQDRLDYILAFPKPYVSGGLEGPVCVQHMTIPTDFRDLESDHFMVHADLNVGFDHCHPQIAREVDLSLSGAGGQPPLETVLLDTENGQNFTRIVRPGTMQWFHVKKEAAGTYSIGLNDPNLKIDIYAPEDLTTPISKYNKVTQTVVVRERRFFTETFILPSEFYIRIAGKTRQTTGDYQLWIKRHTCSSKAEACILQPGQAQSATLTKSGNPLGQQNEAWFMFDVTGTSDVGKDQEITLEASGLPDPGNFAATLEDFVNTNGMNAPAALEEGDRRVFASAMGDGSTGYLKIAQGAPTPNNVPVKARLDTSLRLLNIVNLICIDETNPEFGSDDIFTKFTVDGVTFRAPSSGEIEFDCDEPRDEKSWVSAVGKPTLTFIDSVGMRVLELDDTSANDPSRFKLFPALGPDEMVHDGRADPLRWSFEDGQYRFTYEVRKRENAPVK